MTKKKDSSEQVKEPQEAQVPLHLREDLVFEKPCPKCSAINYSTTVQNRSKPYASIHFNCSECGEEYRNWWYGTGPSYGNQPVWNEILRKPSKAICIRSEKGITVECIYEVLPSLTDPNQVIVLQNDNGWKNTEYPKDYFIVDKKRK